MAKSSSSKPTSNVPPRKSGGGRAAAPPRNTRGSSRPPANRPRRRTRSQGRFYGLLVGLVLAIVAVVVVVLLTSGGSSTSITKQPAINFKANGVKAYGGIGPEGVPLQLGPQLASANDHLTGQPVDGIQCNTSEQLVYHHHIHLAIFVNGQNRAVPLGIGMVPPALVTNTARGPFAQGSQTCLYWLHVHATDGIVHIESPEVRTFLLSQVFGIWGQPLSATQIGPFTGHVTATLDGQPWTGDPSEIPLDEHAQIVLNLNGPVVTPPPIVWNGTGL